MPTTTSHFHFHYHYHSRPGQAWAFITWPENAEKFSARFLFCVFGCWLGHVLACGSGCRYLHLNAACGSPLRLLLCNESLSAHCSQGPETPLTSIPGLVVVSVRPSPITGPDNFHKFSRAIPPCAPISSVPQQRPSTSTFLLCYWLLTTFSHQIEVSLTERTHARSRMNTWWSERLEKRLEISVNHNLLSFESSSVAHPDFRYMTVTKSWLCKEYIICLLYIMYRFYTAQA